MRLFLSILISILFCGCSLKKNVAGKYRSKNGSTSIQLKQDSTFIYEHGMFHSYGQSTGIWRRPSKDSVFLESSIKSVIIPIQVVETANNDSNRLSIKLDIEGNHDLIDYKCEIYVNKLMLVKRRCDSLSSITIPLLVNTIYFRFLREPQIATTDYIPMPLSSSIYHLIVNNKRKIDVQIKFSDTYFYYQTFDHEKANIHRRKSIEIFELAHGKLKELLRVSNSSKLFSRYTDTSTVLNIFR